MSPDTIEETCGIMLGIVLQWSHAPWSIIPIKHAEMQVKDAPVLISREVGGLGGAGLLFFKYSNPVLHNYISMHL